VSDTLDAAGVHQTMPDKRRMAAVLTYNVQSNDGGAHKRADRPNGGLYVKETDTALTVGSTDRTLAVETPWDIERCRGHSADRPSPTLASDKGRGHGVPTVAFDTYNHAVSDITPTIRNECGSASVMAVCQVQWASGGGQVENDTAQALRSQAEHNYQFSRIGMTVRRLMPVECERLQAFPDGWTEYGITEDGKRRPMSDSARYRMLGNAVTVSVIENIGSEIVKALTIERTP